MKFSHFCHLKRHERAKIEVEQMSLQVGGQDNNNFMVGIPIAGQTMHKVQDNLGRAHVVIGHSVLNITGTIIDLDKE